jgi:hypothetical protein
MSGVTPAFQGELMLANWRETHSGGATVTFMLADAADLDLFRHMTVKKSNMAGQRFMAVLVEIGDDEKPVRQSLSQQAALMCKGMAFQQFAEYRMGYGSTAPDLREKIATDFLRDFCGINSRAELDTDGHAGMLYQQLLAEYRAYDTPIL